MLKATCCSARWEENISRTGFARAVFCRHCLQNIVLNELDWWTALAMGGDAQQRQNSKRGAMRREQRLRATPTEALRPERILK
ncbi:MAG: hypothetical protein ACLRKS_06530 [Parabacteroides distasonis]